MKLMTCPHCTARMPLPPADALDVFVYHCNACGQDTELWIDTVIGDHEVSDDPCACGNGMKMVGWRVCYECACARAQYPHLFEGEPPDQIETLVPDDDPANTAHLLL